ncbi:MAG: oligosaccharide flippase family protein, partial [Bacteroidales bacterium]
MRTESFINNISSLQIFQLVRFSTFLLISILFTKSHLSTADIGIYEVFLFIASFISFFWVTGLIQSLLPLYKNNKSFNKNGENHSKKSPEIFNAFILLTIFSFLAFLFGISLRGNFSVFGISGDVPFINLLLVYILLSNPTYLIEYIYLLNDKSHHILGYGSISFSIQLAIVTVPIFMGYDIVFAIWGLIIISILRIVWLVVLLYRYAEFKFSIDFIKEHISLGLPLILSTLLSGSAQYIDGVIVTSTYDAESFAQFRYGAKEFPLVLLLANGLSNAMLSEFSSKEKITSSLKVLKHKSRRLMHYLFPITMVVMLFTRVLYPVMFNENFIRSADVFLIYLLLIISRLVFPQTIIIGLKKTRVILIASFIEIIL